MSDSEQIQRVSGAGLPEPERPVHSPVSPAPGGQEARIGPLLEALTVVCLKAFERGGIHLEEDSDSRGAMTMYWLWFRLLEGARSVGVALREGFLCECFTAARQVFEYFVILDWFHNLDDKDAGIGRLRLQGRHSRIGLLDTLARHEELRVYRKSQARPEVFATQKTRLRNKFKLGNRNLDTTWLIGKPIEEYAKERDLLEDWFILHRWASKHVHPDLEQTKLLFTWHENAPRLRRPGELGWLHAQTGLRSAKLVEQSLEFIEPYSPNIDADEGIRNVRSQIHELLEDLRRWHAAGGNVGNAACQQEDNSEPTGGGPPVSA